MKTSIPASSLPTRLSDPNKLSTTYPTNVLYPKLGPVAVNGYVKLGAKLLRDVFSVLIDKVKDYSRTFNAQVSVIKQPDAWLRDRVVFKPVLEKSDLYSKVFLAGLSSFNEPVVDENPFNQKPASTAPDERSRGRNVSSLVAIGRAEGSISAVTDINYKELKLINDRLVVYELTPAKLFRQKESGVTGLFGNSDTVRLNSEMLNEEILNQKKAYQLGNIMHGFSQENAAMPDFIKAKIVNTEGALIDNALLSSADLTTRIFSSLQPVNAVTDDKVELLGGIIDAGLSMLEKSGVEENTFAREYKSNPDLRKLVKKYCIDKFDRLECFGGRGLPSPFVPVNTHTREWAFQRIERMDLLMGEPELRGPFNAESVTPNSELTIAESFTNEQFDFSERTEGRSQQQSNERAVFTSSSFQSALSNITESGISDDNSFTTNATLLNTLREQKRAAVDRTLTNISTANENRTVSGSRNISSTSRTYTTRGKDAKFATTELAFQVSSKVNVEVYLEDVNLVWAPYIYSPFLYTHQIIQNHKNVSIFEYIEQNNVVDPVRPLEEYELGTFKKEIAIDGSDTSQSKNFDFVIPAQWDGDGWDLDKAGTTIAYRNGRSGDYDIWDRPNWDDLENWSVYFKTLEKVGNRVTGEATLETTDPEWLNRGFLVFNFQMRRLTERSKADLRAYTAEQVSAEAERRAVTSRARQYGELRKEELINRYAQSFDLREEAFTELIKRVFVGFPSAHLSYYKEIIRSCIDWNNVTMQFDTNRANNLPFAEYSRSHFMNSPGIRFILPVIRTAEDVFFETIRSNGNNYYESAITEIKTYTDDYRTRIEEFKISSPENLILDKYTREIILGRHFEAVLSNHPFAE